MLPSFTISPIPFALKTAFTFTLNRAAKMQCSFTTDVDIRISLRNGLDFQYKTSFSLRHSPNWQIISLLTLKHLHYALLGPEKACLSFSPFIPPHMLPPKWPSEQISPSPFLLLSARWCWGKLNLANKVGGGWGMRRIQSRSDLVSWVALYHCQLLVPFIERREKSPR